MALERMKSYIDVVGMTLVLAMSSSCVSTPDLVEPSCSMPAPLDGTFDRRAPGYIVMFADGVSDAAAVTRELARKHGFTPESIFRSIKGFAVEVIRPTALANLRCESTIKGISFNQRTQTAHCSVSC